MAASALPRAAELCVPGVWRPRSAPLPFQGPEHIYCSCVSPCGSWVAYSTASRFHLYRVQYEGDGISIKKVRRVMSLPAAGKGWWVAVGSRGAGTANVAHGERGWQW